MSDQDARYARLRHTATGALAALAAVGAIAGTVALANPGGKAHGHAAANDTTANTVTCPAPTKDPASAPAVNDQPFLTDIQRLVDAGTITAAEGQVVDREIQLGRIDTDTLAAAGFTQAQMQAVQQALSDTKRSMAQRENRTSK